MSAIAKTAIHTGNPRYLVRHTHTPIPPPPPPSSFPHSLIPSSSSSSPQAENILKVELDMPNRTTHDYQGPVMAPSLQAALSKAMTDEEEITVDAG